LLADEDISMEDSLFSNFFDTQKTVLKSVSKLAKITKSRTDKRTTADGNLRETERRALRVKAF
jgi:hypothetical protein